MRLKISFDDIKLLFNYLDKRGLGEIGYDEFTMLLEERWRGIDPIAERQASLIDSDYKNPMSSSFKPALNVYSDCITE